MSRIKWDDYEPDVFEDQETLDDLVEGFDAEDFEQKIKSKARGPDVELCRTLSVASLHYHNTDEVYDAFAKFEGLPVSVKERALRLLETVHEKDVLPFMPRAIYLAKLDSDFSTLDKIFSNIPDGQSAWKKVKTNVWRLQKLQDHPRFEQIAKSYIPYMVSGGAKHNRYLQAIIAQPIIGRLDMKLVDKIPAKLLEVLKEPSSDPYINLLNQHPATRFLTEDTFTQMASAKMTEELDDFLRNWLSKTSNTPEAEFYVQIHANTGPFDMQYIGHKVMKAAAKRTRGLEPEFIKAVSMIGGGLRLSRKVMNSLPDKASPKNYLKALKQAIEDAADKGGIANISDPIRTFLERNLLDQGLTGIADSPVVAKLVRASRLTPHAAYNLWRTETREEIIKIGHFASQHGKLREFANLAKHLYHNQTPEDIAYAKGSDMEALDRLATIVPNPIDYMRAIPDADRATICVYLRDNKDVEHLSNVKPEEALPYINLRRHLEHKAPSLERIEVLRQGLDYKTIYEHSEYLNLLCGVDSATKIFFKLLSQKPSLTKIETYVRLQNKPGLVFPDFKAILDILDRTDEIFYPIFRKSPLKPDITEKHLIQMPDAKNKVDTLIILMQGSLRNREYVLVAARDTSLEILKKASKLYHDTVGSHHLIDLVKSTPDYDAKAKSIKALIGYDAHRFEMIKLCARYQPASVLEMAVSYLKMQERFPDDDDKVTVESALLVSARPELEFEDVDAMNKYMIQILAALSQNDNISGEALRTLDSQADIFEKTGQVEMYIQGVLDSLKNDALDDYLDSIQSQLFEDVKGGGQYERVTA